MIHSLSLYSFISNLLFCSYHHLQFSAGLTFSMEDTVKESKQPLEQNSSGNAGRSASRLLRYPLRSASKSKEDKPPLADSFTSPAPKRGRAVPSVSKSVNVLDLSGKEKSVAKPPRRLSIPSKSTASSATKSVGTITPISEARARRSITDHRKGDTLITRSSSRKKFSALSSASYWLEQIKHSETAAKHSISLGFFKLALESGCEPLQRMRDELITYAQKYSLVDLGEPAKEVFQSYNIIESFEKLQVSETCSHVPEEETRSYDDDAHSLSSVKDTENLNPVGNSTSDSAKQELTDKDAAKPELLDTDAANSGQMKDLKEAASQKSEPVSRFRRSAGKSTANSKPAVEVKGRNMQKKPHKSRNQETNKNKDVVKKQGMKSGRKEGGPIIASSAEKTLEGDKENLGAAQVEEINVTEV